MDIRNLCHSMATATDIAALGVYQELLEETEVELKKLAEDGKIKKKAYNEVRDVVFNAFVRISEIQENFTFCQTYNALCAVWSSLIDTKI